MKICRGNPYLVKIGQKCRFIVTGGINLVNWYQFVSISEEVSKLRERATMFPL